MQSLIVVLALFVGAVFADIPLDYKKYGDRMRSSSSRIGSSENQYPLTSSEYLKRALARDSGMVDVVAPKETVLGVGNGEAENALDLLPRLGLIEADKIAKKIDLKTIVRESHMRFVTLFIPNDAAIGMWRRKVSAELAEDKDVLTSLAKAWIVPDQAVWYHYIYDEMLLATLATDVKLRTNIYGSSVVTVNGANVVDGNYREGENIIHIIDGMIYPLPDGNIVDTLAKVDEFSVLVDLVKKAGLQQILSAYNGMTLLAPDNSAFDLVPSDIMAELKANKTKLQRLINHHVIPKTYYTTGMMIDGIVYNGVGEKMAVDFDGDKFVITAKLDQSKDQTSKAGILYSDIPATNGVIHVIDKVFSIKYSQQ